MAAATFMKTYKREEMMPQIKNILFIDVLDCSGAV